MPYESASIQGMDLSEHVARALHENGPMTEPAVGLKIDAYPHIARDFDVRAALFNLYLAGQLQFWRQDGDWTESATGSTRVMGDVHYALARNHAVDVNAWFMWHGEGQ